MSEKENSNEPVDQFFRKKLDDYQGDYREEDWLKLEKKLDVMAAQRLYRIRLAWIAAASILIVSMMAWSIIENRVKINELAQMVMSDQPQQESVPQASLAPRDHPVPINPTPRIDGFMPEQRPLQGDLPVPSVDADPVMERPTDPERYPQIETRPPRPLAARMPDIVVDGGLPAAITGHRTVQTAGVPLASRTDPLSGKPTPSVKPSPPYPDPYRMDDFPKSAHRSRLALGIAYSPNFSTAGSPSNAYEPGYHAGVNLEYRIASRLVVSTGMIYGMVRYSAGDSDYDLPAGYFGDSGFSGMSGTCRILDIPVSLQLRILNFDRSRIYGTAGVSTYVMLDEAYTFRNDGYNHTNDSEILWQEQTGTWHWLSTAGFSVGYEWDLDRNWSIRAEPFARIPVREVGWTNVRLYSFGTFFSINYRL